MNTLRPEFAAAILETVHDAIIVIDGNQDILLFSHGAERCFGYSKEETLGHPVAMLLPKALAGAHRALVDEFVASASQARIMGHRQEIFGRRKDGTDFPAEATIANWSDGKRTTLIAVVRDITERKQVEAQLQEREQQLRSLLEGMTEGCQLIGPDWRYLFVNGAVTQHAKRTKEELLGHTMMEVYPGIEQTEMFAALRRCMETRTSHRMLNEFAYPDGRRGWFELSIEPVPRGLLILSTDITDRRAMEARLLQTEKLETVGRLAGGIAHDFNNLLTPIMGYADLGATRLPAGDPSREDFEEIRKAAESAAGLTRQLLAFGRQQVLRPRPLDLNATVKAMEKLLTRTIGANIDLRFVLGADLKKTLLDPSQVEQCVVNLALNARDAMPNGGELTIETGNVVFDAQDAAAHGGVSPGAYVLLAVSDSGVGMDDATRQHIFEPFYSTKPGTGTGLGLSSVYGIVNQSGGNIWVYSEPGQGATFRLYFPVTEQERDTTERAAASDQAAVGGSETILLVEDHGAARVIAAKVLKDAGYTVLSAATPREALDRSLRYRDRIELLLTDIVLPEMTGRQLAAQLTNTRPELKLIFMSGYTADAVHHQGMLAENVDFLEKPFLPAALLRLVREVLDRAVA